jgi:hypothetical protein
MKDLALVGFKHGLLENPLFIDGVPIETSSHWRI